MSKYIGDFSKNDTITFMFTTFRPSTGAPFALAGTPVVSVYKDNNLTQDTAGITLTTNYDGVTGLNFVSIATTGAFYVDGSSYECVITTGTVDAVSVVGSCIGRFTMRDQAYLYPTTAGRTLDVSATGEAGIDLANVGSPTTTLNLSGTTISTGQTITSVSGSVGSVTGAVASVTGNVGGNVTGSVGSLSATAQTNVASAVWNALLATYTTANTFGARLIRTLSSSATNEVTIGGSNHIAANIHATQPNVIDAGALATSAVDEIADGILNRNIGGGSSTGRVVKDAFRAIRNKSVIATGTLTVYQEDDTTSAWTATVGSDPSAEPIISIDPA